MLVKNFFFGQNKRYKNAFFFLSQGPTHEGFTFNSRFLYELKHQFVISKTVSEIFKFQFRFVFIKAYVLLNKKHRLLDFKLS